jgi:hypothetical protein
MLERLSAIDPGGMRRAMERAALRSLQLAQVVSALGGITPWTQNEPGAGL